MMYMRVANPRFFIQESEPTAQDAETTFSKPANVSSVSTHNSEPNVVRCSTITTPTNNSPRQFLSPSDHHGNHRRLSQGDAPYWLPQECQEELGSRSRLPRPESESFLLGRALVKSDSQRRVRLTEVAPSNTNLRGGESNGWMMPVEIFSSKKETDMKRFKSKRVRSYYKAQAELITAFEDVNQVHGIDLDMETLTKPSYKMAVLLSKITLFINLLLMAAKAVAAVLSSSISIISSLVDSAVDLLSGVIMWWATRQVRNRDPYTYPQGRTKLEPVAVIILSVVMSLASLQLLRESIEKIISLASASMSLPTMDAVTFAIAGSTVVVKLILWSVCRRVDSPSVRALALDHRNDVVSNTVAIICGYVGSRNFQDAVGGMYGFSYADPIGAIIISVYIMYNWWLTGSEQIQMLTGLTARPEFLSQLTWLALNHHPKIRHIDTVRAFHFGQNYLVEVDIVLPIDMMLREAHDIGETLQHKLESLSEVERAFVHLDYEYLHDPRSEHKQV